MPHYDPSDGGESYILKLSYQSCIWKLPLKCIKLINLIKAINYLKLLIKKGKKRIFVASETKTNRIIIIKKAELAIISNTINKFIWNKK